jgi:iron-sulfur cluster assembly protein
MLTLTETASNVVKAIIEQSPDTENAGLRINSQGVDASAELGVAVVDAPEASDQVLEHDGARVFLDEGATVALADKVLDAQVGNDGSVSFAIGQQAV